MSKELTEQWRNGTLKDGAYYILVDKYEQNEPEIDVGICYNSNFEWWIVKEVLAPVPTYDQFADLSKKADQFSQLVKKVEDLRELIIEGRFVEALKVLEDK